MAINTSRLHSYRIHLLAKTDFSSAKETLAQALKHTADLEDRLIALFPQIHQGFVDNPLQTNQPKSLLAPPQVQFTVGQKNGFSFVSITPPNFSDPQTAQLFALALKRNPNLQQAPLIHKLQSATTDSFDTGANVTAYAPSQQLFFTLPDANPHWRVQSSFDGVNFNPPTATVKAINLP